jgi:O-antigen/teichoic acid export membrane protein
MTGTTVAQAIPIAISPILTRIYTPEDFGLFALFVAITSVFGSIANGRYELAIMLPNNDEDAINVSALGIIITCILSLVLLFTLVLFNNTICNILNNQDISLWLYFVPLVVFLIGSFNVLNYYNTRKKQFKDISKSIIIKSIVLAVLQLVIGFIKTGVTGLISGQIISQIFANSRLVKNIIGDKKLISAINIRKMIFLAKRYISFPKFSMPAILANTLSLQLTNILISAFYSLTTLGFYSLVQRVLGMPSALIGNSIGQVFFQEATLEKKKTGQANKTFKSTVKKLIIIGLPFYIFLFFVVKDLFLFVFGENWGQAGEYAQILIPLFFIRFVVSTVTSINSVFELQKVSLVWQLILLFFAISIMILSNHYLFEFSVFLTIYAIVISLHYIVLFFLLKRISKKGQI